MSSIDQHYKDNWKNLTKRARNMVPNKCPSLAQDAVQEAYLRVIYYSKYSPKRDFDKYFSNVLRNVCNNMHNSNKMQGMSIDDVAYKDEELQLEEICQAFDQAQKENDARKVLTGKLIGVSENTQVIINMFRNGISITDIGIYQGKSRQTVHNTIKRFMGGLHE